MAINNSSFNWITYFYRKQMVNRRVRIKKISFFVWSMHRLESSIETLFSMIGIAGTPCNCISFVCSSSWALFKCLFSHFFHNQKIYYVIIIINDISINMEFAAVSIWQQDHNKMWKSVLTAQSNFTISQIKINYLLVMSKPFPTGHRWRIFVFAGLGGQHKYVSHVQLQKVPSKQKKNSFWLVFKGKVSKKFTNLLHGK